MSEYRLEGETDDDSDEMDVEEFANNESGAQSADWSQSANCSKPTHESKLKENPIHIEEETILVLQGLQSKTMEIKLSRASFPSLNTYLHAEIDCNA